jgi:hypothetical protein
LIIKAKSIIHHDMIIFISIFITHLIIPSADVCIVESTFYFTMVGPSFVSFHKTTLYQMHLDGINIFPHKFVATITIWTTYLNYVKTSNRSRDIGNGPIKPVTVNFKGNNRLY